MIWIILILLLIVVAAKSIKYIPYVLVIGGLYAIFGNATSGILLIVGIIYFRSWINKVGDEKEKNNQG